NPQQDRGAKNGGAAPAQGRHRELSASPIRGARSAQSSGRSSSRHAPRPVWSRALCRARRFHGGSAEEILPTGARKGSPTALCLFHHVPRGGEKRKRGGGRAALHI